MVNCYRSVLNYRQQHLAILLATFLKSLLTQTKEKLKIKKACNIKLSSNAKNSQNVRIINSHIDCGLWKFLQSTQ